MYEDECVLPTAVCMAGTTLLTVFAPHAHQGKGSQSGAANKVQVQLGPAWKEAKAESCISLNTGAADDLQTDLL